MSSVVKGSPETSCRSPSLGLRDPQHLVIAIGVGLLALVVLLWELSVPELLQLYDSGVYFGATLHFVNGVLPYRDFTFVQPPGILLLLSPVALMGRIFGSHDGFVLARVVTACVSGLNAGLLAWLVRHRGRVAMMVAGVGLALLPVSLLVGTTVELDPYCICLISLGSLAAFREKGKKTLTTRSLTGAGIVFGLAALIKLSGILSVHRPRSVPGTAISQENVCLRRRRRGRLCRSVTSLLYAGA